MIHQVQLDIDADEWIALARPILKGELDLHLRPEFTRLFDAIREHLPTEILWAQALRGDAGQRRFARSDALYRNRKLISGMQFYCFLSCGQSISFPNERQAIESRPGLLVTFDSRVGHGLACEAGDCWAAVGVCGRSWHLGMDHG